MSPEDENIQQQKKKRKCRVGNVPAYTEICFDSDVKHALNAELATAGNDSSSSSSSSSTDGQQIANYEEVIDHEEAEAITDAEMKLIQCQKEFMNDFFEVTPIDADWNVDWCHPPGYPVFD